MLGVILPLSIIGALGASLLGSRANRGLLLSGAALIALAGLVILGVPWRVLCGFLRIKLLGTLVSPMFTVRSLSKRQMV